MTDSLSVARHLAGRLGKVADDFAISTESYEQAQVKFSNSRVSTTQRWISRSIGVFAAIGRRTLATSIEPSVSAADRCVEKLVAFSRAVGENNQYMGIAKGPFRYGGFAEFDKGMNDVDMADVVAGAIGAASEVGVKRCSGVFETCVGDRHLLTSSGVDALDKYTRAYFSLRAMADSEGSGHGVSASRGMRGLGYVRAAREAAEVAVASRNPSPVDEGVYDVFFEHLPAANLMDVVSGAASVFYVESGLSFFGGKVGKRVASSSLSMADEPVLYSGVGSRRFDDEGSPSRKANIISRGVLKSYLHNASTAARYGVSSTASAGIVSPRPSNVVVQPGKSGKDSIIRGIKKGLVVTNVWYTRFSNYSTGDFSTIPRDGVFLVENGKIKKAVRGIRISDNLLRMLSNVSSVSSDLRQVMGWELERPISVPQVLVKGVRVTKSVE
ncbi:TldD/PmbA family protein [Candidatus Woesearchaeota archaeon]|nr:TldD/PmbA family protein [Candidatus Woesearchaeota archaeon]